MTAASQFIAKLFKLVHAPQEQSYIQWNEDGTQFWVTSVENFSRDVLPLYYKHNNIASFVRQLNMYGFHRNTEPKGKVEPGITMIEKFSHPMFLRGREDLIVHIHRKTAAATKRVKQEEIDNTGTLALPTYGAAPREIDDDISYSMAQMREVVARLEGQNASLVAQSLQQQEILNHIIRVLARHNLLAEVELPRNSMSLPYYRNERPAIPGASAGAVVDAAATAAAAAAAAAAANANNMASGGEVPQMKWAAESPPELQVFVDDEEVISSMLDQLMPEHLLNQGLNTTHSVQTPALSNMNGAPGN